MEYDNWGVRGMSEEPWSSPPILLRKRWRSGHYKYCTKVSNVVRFKHTIPGVTKRKEFECIDGGGLSMDVMWSMSWHDSQCQCQWILCTMGQSTGFKLGFYRINLYGGNTVGRWNWKRNQYLAVFNFIWLGAQYRPTIAHRHGISF